MSKVGVGLLLSAVLVLTPMWAAAAEFKVGVVDSMDIISKSAEGKRVEDSIKRKTEELSRPFAQKRQELAKQVEDFQKQGADAEKKLQQFKEKEGAPLFQKLEVAVKAVAQQEKLDMVLDKRSAGLLFMDPKLDLTDKVRSKFGN